MDIVLIGQMVVVALLGAALYTIIGIAPGTDETAVLAPVTLVLVISGMVPILVLTFFIAAIVAKKLTDSIPVAVAGIPGGVMSAPMVEDAMVLKENGEPEASIRNMESGSVSGTIVSVPLSQLLARALIPLADVIEQYSSQIFFFSAIFLGLMTKNRWFAVLSIVP